MILIAEGAVLAVLGVGLIAFRKRASWPRPTTARSEWTAGLVGVMFLCFALYLVVAASLSGTQ